MKSFPRSQLFAQVPRGMLSAMGDAKELESRAAALEEYKALWGNSDLLSQHDWGRTGWTK